MHTETPDLLKQRLNWLIAISVLLIIVGITAIVSPIVTAIVAVTWIAAFITIAGIALLVHAFQSRHEGGFIWKLLLGLLYVTTGILLVLYPLQGVLTLTVLIGAFLVVEGIFEIILATQLRSTANWVWMLLNGILTLILGIIIWSQSPLNAVSLVGTLVGVSILFSGVSRLMLAIAMRSRLRRQQ